MCKRSHRPLVYVAKFKNITGSEKSVSCLRNDQFCDDLISFISDLLKNSLRFCSDQFVFRCLMQISVKFKAVLRGKLYNLKEQEGSRNQLEQSTILQEYFSQETHCKSRWQVKNRFATCVVQKFSEGWFAKEAKTERKKKTLHKCVKGRRVEPFKHLKYISGGFTRERKDDDSKKQIFKFLLQKKNI